MVDDWKSMLKADPTDWLLEEENPSVRYFALIDLLDRPTHDPDVIRAKADIMVRGAVPEILARQRELGFWGAPDKFYTDKYRGTVWQLLILASLGADGRDAPIHNACEFLLANSQERASHGFSIDRNAKLGGGRHSGVIPCLTGNAVWSLIRFGYLGDERVRRGIDWITEYQRFDDGETAPPPGWRYDRWEACFGRHTCHMGVVKAMKALAEIPAGERTAQVQRTLEEGIDFMLKHHVYKRSHAPSQVAKPGWLRFGFPLMYQTDVLEVLEIMTRLGCRDERLQEAMDAVLAQQDADGRWKLASTFNGKFHVDIEEKGKPSKWITLGALRLLKRCH